MGKISFSAFILCLRHTQKRGGVHFFLVYFPEEQESVQTHSLPKTFEPLDSFQTDWTVKTDESKECKG